MQSQERCILRLHHFVLLSVWGQLIFFSIIILLPHLACYQKGMGESIILSEDEPLTPNIDGVMAL